MCVCGGGRFSRITRRGFNLKVLFEQDIKEVTELGHVDIWDKSILDKGRLNTRL